MGKDDKADRDALSDRDLLIRIDERVAQIQDRLNDHGRRLRLLERSGAVAAGASAILAVVAGWMKVKVTIQ